ncbi:MAG: sigma 54-interacting transcriptional regulator [Myxococcales bacterium]|nr:sigma 54-interacting transcriptional regulator [Myxococcales bacterium]
MPSLVVDGRSHLIVRKITSIGADRDNDVVVEGAEVAPTHAHIRLEGGRFVLVSTARANTLRVNGRKTRKHPLEHADAIELGDATLRFNLWDEPTTIEVQRDVVPQDELKAYRRLLAFSTSLAQKQDVDAMLEALMDEVVQLTGADKGFLVLTNDGDGLRVQTARNLNRESMEATLDHVSDSIISRAMQAREPVIVSDALNDTTFRASASVMQLKLCSVMCVPLVFAGELLGLIYVGNDNVVNLFEQQHLDVLVVFAGQAALLVQHAMQRAALSQDNARLRQALEGEKFGSIVGSCDAMKAVFRKVEKVAATDINVLVLGETGTGKELIAREIHRRSPRAEGPFVAVNCGAIPENLMESELFGHRRGAFTGAVENKVGSFQAANGGTLFLDEIGEMPVHLQVKLLRAIQERVITRVGDTKPTPVDLRLVVATNVDLEEAIKEGRFREDLYYRINVVGIELPPLRDRDDDVVLIARFLLSKYAESFGRPVVGFTNDAIIAMRKHAWPGNIRELENRLKKGVVLADGPKLTPEDLDLDDDVLAGRVLPLAEAKDAFQRRYIDEVLALNDGNRTKTARDLGVDPRTIFRHLEKKRDEGDDEDTDS